MLKAIFDWFKQPSPKAFAPAVQPEAAPYKVEAAPQVAPVLEAAPVVSKKTKYTEMEDFIEVRAMDCVIRSLVGF